MAMAMNVLLGRRLLAPKTTTAATATATETDSLEALVARDDRFFCDTMELIPAQHYFPTDEEENWLKSAPKNGKKAKYHREVLAQKQQGSSKQAVKRAKFNPSEQKTNEERQQEAADAERKQKAAALPVTAAKDPSAVSIDGLKERLQAKLQALREQRHADGQTGKKRAAPAATEPASKKRKSASQSSAFNQKALSKKVNGEQPAPGAASASTEAEPAVEVSAGSISYGSLLLPGEEKAETKKTRNGQALRGIKNLLKKAERNQQRMEELKKTEEGKALVQAKNWNKALKQAAGEVVMDDPKLLRKKLKKKEKQKTKSSKEWKKRTAQVEMQKKERQKKRLENLRTGGKKDKDKDKDKAGAAPRAGFEGKKGEHFLNADKAKKKE
ncbi:hypothetical protein ATCC90586_008142 [Pythium insidiosum]|nr:hypothetical protein ATCC90586_008142 [Pythium insidiosum]